MKPSASMKLTWFRWYKARDAGVWCDGVMVINDRVTCTSKGPRTVRLDRHACSQYSAISNQRSLTDPCVVYSELVCIKMHVNIRTCKIVNAL